MKTVFRSFLVMVLLAVCAPLVTAQRTTRRPLRAKTVLETVDTISSAAIDTISSPGKLVVVSGYEKPLRSMRETLHITNADTLRVLRGVVLDIVYLDVDENQVHRKSVSLGCNILPGETIMLAFKSWDLQNRFYYAEGPKPRTSAYPFTIKVVVKSGLYARP